MKRYKTHRTPHKNLILSTLCLMPYLSAPALANEGVVAPATVAPPVANVTSPVIAPVAVATNEINNIIATKQHPYSILPDFTHRADDLDALYKSNQYQPIWLGNDAKAIKNSTEVVKLLANAGAYGLNPANYDAQLLQEKSVKPPQDMQSKDAALYDTAISLSLLRFMHDLHYGRINPKNLHFNIQLRTAKTLDLPALIKASVAQETVSQLPALVESKLPQYQKMQQALTDYHSTEKAPPLKLMVKTPVRAGNALPQSAELQQFLSAFGDLPADKIDNAATTYTPIIVEGVKKFQQRHGLKANGIINNATVSAFNAPLTQAQRITQIELAMERLRWIPEITEGRAVIVNIPAFQLWAFDDIKQDNATTTMRVVVGKSKEHQTPQLTADMQFVDFQPYWNVPYKIAKDEIMPKLAEDPDYLARQNMEFVKGSSRIRQRPGKGNALGKVKFIFPNSSNVYLHDTPSVGLFSRSRRDLSHGCVRVSRPQDLAEFVLKEQGGWDTGSIKKAMGGKNRQVVLKKTIPVLFLYNTAFFDGNNLTFYSDIYGRDAQLLAALKKQEDLSDEVLFAPKEVLPVDESSPERIEAAHTAPVVAANTAQAVPVVQHITASNTDQLAPTTQPVISTEEKSVLSP